MPLVYQRGPVYERVDERGEVVERVQPLAGDFEDTRLGVAVLDGTGGWRLADAEPADSQKDPPGPDSASTEPIEQDPPTADTPTARRPPRRRPQTITEE